MNFTKAIEQFLRDNKKIAILFEDVIRGYLAQRGWFVGGSLNAQQYLVLKKGIEQHQETAIENFMIKHVRSKTKEVAADAYAIWPHRRTVLVDAFDAHSKGLYTLSVPVLLAQADGMTHEIFGAFLFTNRRGKKIRDKAKSIIETELEERPLAKSFLGLLLEESGLRLETQKRDEQEKAGISVSPLNRHGVLHGIDCNYPREWNSLRAVALIGFLNWVHEIKSK